MTRVKSVRRELSELGRGAGNECETAVTHTDQPVAPKEDDRLVGLAIPRLVLARLLLLAQLSIADLWSA
jgi:hypothetical protein